MDCQRELGKMEEALSEAEKKLLKMKQVLMTVLTPPFKNGVVIEKTKHFLIVSVGDDRLVVNVPPTDVVPQPVEVGDAVALAQETGQIVSLLPAPSKGDMGIVKTILKNSNLLKIEVNGNESVAHPGKLAGVLSPGDIVLVDRTHTIIFDIVEENKTEFHFDRPLTTSWNDIGGLDEAKELLREAIEYPIQYKKMTEFYNKKPVAGVFLFGPSGCGKTKLAEACATSLAKMYGANNAGFILIKGPQILSKFVAVAEQAITNTFKIAIAFGEQKKTRAVIFIDEAEAILRKRGTGRSSDIESTVVPAFLSEMSGLGKSNYSPLVILATNREDVIDPAIVRDGRMDRKIYVSKPNRDAVKDIFKIHVRHVPFSKEENWSDVAKEVVEHLYKDRPMYKVLLAGTTAPTIFHFHNLITGAMIEGIVNRAVSSAFKRDIAANKAVGVKKEDFIKGIEESFVEHAHTNHEEDLVDFVQGQKVLALERIA